MMEQYLQALRDREDISEGVLLELEERFKVVEEEIPEREEPRDLEQEIDELRQTIDILLGADEIE